MMRFKYLSNKIIKYTLIVFTLSLIIVFFQKNYALADELKKIRKDHAKMLKQTKEHWISWRYYTSRLMFYTTSIVTLRCGVEEAFFGITEDKIDIDLKIGKPDETYGDINIVKLKKMLYEESPNGCDPLDPYNSSGLIVFFYLDNINEESDSLVGLDKETQLIESIWVKIKFAYDKEFSKPVEFKIPKAVLRQIEAEKS